MQLIYNFGDAMKLTGLLWLVWQGSSLLISYVILGKFSIAQYVIDDPYVNNPSGEASGSLGTFLLAGLIIMIISAIIAPWIAVLWHRYMLLNEIPKSNVPKWQADLIWRYLLKSIKVTLIVFLVFIPLITLAVITTKPREPVEALSAFSITEFLAAIFFTYAFLRIALVLPAIALGKNMTIKQSWNHTKPVNRAIIIASILLGLVTYILSSTPLLLPTQILQNQLFIPFYGFFADWVVLMIGIAILTTLYGHLVDGREL